MGGRIESSAWGMAGAIVTVLLAGMGLQKWVGTREAVTEANAQAIAELQREVERLPGTDAERIESLVVRLESLERAVGALRAGGEEVAPANESLEKGVEQQESGAKKYIYAKTQREGTSFVDPKTGAAIGAETLLSTTLRGSVSLPGSATVRVTASAGDSWRFTFDGREFRLALTAVDGGDDTFSAEVREE